MRQPRGSLDRKCVRLHGSMCLQDKENSSVSVLIHQIRQPFSLPRPGIMIKASFTIINLKIWFGYRPKALI